MSFSSLYCTLYSLKQGNLFKKEKQKNKNMSPWTYKFTMHSGSDADVLVGITSSAWTAEQRCQQAQQLTDIAHSTAFVPICVGLLCFGLVGSSGGIFFLQQHSSQAVGKGQRSGLACMNWPHVKTSIWLSSVGTYLLCWVGIFCLMLLRTTKLHKTRR